MKTTLLWGTAVFVLSTLPAAAATVYTCTDGNGRTTYSQQSGKHCKKADIGKLGTYSNAPAAGIEPYSDTAASENARQADGSQEKKAAQRQLEEARKALADGRQTRYGHERNYARYQERIRQLEQAVQQAQNRLDELNRSATLPSDSAY